MKSCKKNGRDQQRNGRYRPASHWVVVSHWPVMDCILAFGVQNAVSNGERSFEHEKNSGWEGGAFDYDEHAAAVEAAEVDAGVSLGSARHCANAHTYNLENKR